MGRRIVITGISDHWATELAKRLERDPSVEFVAGIDTEPPAAELERTELIEADIRNPGDDRIADVGLDQLRALQLGGGWLGVDPGHELDGRVTLEPLRELGRPVVRDSRDHDPAAHHSPSISELELR